MLPSPVPSSLTVRTYSCELRFGYWLISAVLVANKALLDAKPSLSDQLRPVISSTTSIVLLQNGVGAEAPLHESFPDNTIISAVVWTGGRSISSEKDGQAGAEQFNREGLTIGVDYRSEDAGVKQEEKKRLDTLVQWLEAGKGECTVTEEIQTERWIKVIWSVPVQNALLASLLTKPQELLLELDHNSHTSQDQPILRILTSSLTAMSYCHGGSRRCSTSEGNDSTRRHCREAH